MGTAWKKKLEFHFPPNIHQKLLAFTLICRSNAEIKCIFIHRLRSQWKLTSLYKYGFGIFATLYCT